MKEREKRKTSVEELNEENDENKKTRRASGEPESHLSAVGGGGIAGAATGAAIGTAVGGPVGGAIGAAAGGVAGMAAADKAIDQLDPKIEEDYWKENFKNRPYYKPGDEYESYAAAYKFGWEAAGKREYKERSYKQAEAQLERDWKAQRGSMRDWSEVKEIVRDSYERVRSKE